MFAPTLSGRDALLLFNGQGLLARAVRGSQLVSSSVAHVVHGVGETFLKIPPWKFCAIYDHLLGHPPNLEGLNESNDGLDLGIWNLWNLLEGGNKLPTSI